jgi:hypothetical protein
VSGPSKILRQYVSTSISSGLGSASQATLDTRYLVYSSLDFIQTSDGIIEHCALYDADVVNVESIS